MPKCNCMRIICASDHKVEFSTGSEQRGYYDDTFHSVNMVVDDGETEPLFEIEGGTEVDKESQLSDLAEAFARVYRLGLLHRGKAK